MFLLTIKLDRVSFKTKGQQNLQNKTTRGEQQYKQEHNNLK